MSPSLPSRSPAVALLPELEALFSEFSAIADRLAMPLGERIGITGLSAAGYHALSLGWFAAQPSARDRCARRLRYSLPLLRRLLANCEAACEPEPACPPPGGQYGAVRGLPSRN
jgi:hypothetical protein